MKALVLISRYYYHVDWKSMILTRTPAFCCYNNEDILKTAASLLAVDVFGHKDAATWLNYCLDGIVSSLDKLSSSSSNYLL
jgi:hypothetical protein